MEAGEREGMTAPIIAGKPSDPRRLRAKELREQGLTCRQIGKSIGRSATTVSLYLRDLERREALAMEPGGELSTRSFNALRYALGWSFDEFREVPVTPEVVAERLTLRELKAAENVGKKSFEEIRIWLARYGLALKG